MMWFICGFCLGAALASGAAIVVLSKFITAPRL
jgi:hypothetical protein